MRFKNFRLWNWLGFLLIACLYPAFAYVSNKENPLLAFINALTIVGIVFVVMGIILSLVVHGDFDITEYVARRAVNKKHMKSYEAFKADKQEKREDHFNYPLLTGIFMIVVSALLTIYVY